MVILTRRGVLTLAAGVGVTAWTRLYAANSDFWNKKPPADWSSEEVDRLITRSPWAKEVTAEFSSQERGGGSTGPAGGGRSRGGLSIPGIPGGGIGMGGPRMGGGRGSGGGGGGRSGGERSRYQGTVRWESAKPVLEALKTPLPEAFAEHYVISVSGFPLMNSYGRGEEESQSSQDVLDRIKGLTSLQPKGKDLAQPGLIQQQPSSSGTNLLFGFSKELLTLGPGDKEVTFLTHLGRLAVKTRFNLQEMLYRGDLAV